MREHKCLVASARYTSSIGWEFENGKGTYGEVVGEENPHFYHLTLGLFCGYPLCCILFWCVFDDAPWLRVWDKGGMYALCPDCLVAKNE